MGYIKIDSENFNKVIIEELDKTLKEAAEPIIKRTLEEIEIELREKLASKVISIHRFIKYEMMQDNMVITVRLPDSEKGRA